eukprot:5712375-Pyramimonas_sp.AAC.1
MDTSSRKHARAAPHRWRRLSSTGRARRPLFPETATLPEGSLQRAWRVSPLSKRAAALDGAHF